MTKKNKVKYNLRNVHYAKLLTNTAEGATYETPVPMEGAVSMSLSADGEPEDFYADGYAYFTISNNTGYSGDLELAMIPESFLTDILKEEKDEKGILLENANAVTENFALLMEFDGDQTTIRHVCYCCSVSRPNIESATKEESIEVKTETLTLNISPLACGYVKGKTGDDVDSDIHKNWYNSVYFPSSSGDTDPQ